MDVDSGCGIRLLRFLLSDNLRMGKINGKYWVTLYQIGVVGMPTRLASVFDSFYFPFEL